VTSTHKDPYENIYCVVRGFKDFILFPPTDLPWLRYQTCTQAKYSRNPGGGFRVVDLPDLPPIPWIVVDPLDPGESACVTLQGSREQVLQAIENFSTMFYSAHKLCALMYTVMSYDYF
jgi:hypothetical protein